MNKQELVEHVSERGLSHKDATAALNAIVETISEALARGDKVQLVGFGTFSLTERPARKARNPRTGEQMDVPPSRVPKFKPGETLKKAVNS